MNNDEFVDAYATYLLATDEENPLETANAYLFDRYAQRVDDTLDPSPPEGLEPLADLPLSFEDLSPDDIGLAFDGVIARLGAQGESGSFYTPPEIVEFMVQETVRAQIRDRLDNVGVDVSELDDKPSPEEIAAACSPEDAEAVLENLQHMSVLDPACGSGQFLVGAVDELATIREKLLARTDSERPWPWCVWQSVGNVYGVDLLDEAVAMCRLRLKLRTLRALPDDAPQDDLERIREGRVLQHHIKQGNSLIGMTDLDDLEDALQQDEPSGQTTLSGGEWS